MPGEIPDSAAVEQKVSREQKRKEHEGQFDRLVLGHPLHEIDTDQVIGKKVAEMLGLLPKDIPIECVAQVDEKYLNSSDALVIEGFSSKRAGTNTLETGNFHNGPHDEPAAYMIMTSVVKNLPQRDDPKYTGDDPDGQKLAQYRADYKQALNGELGRRIKSPQDRLKLQNLLGWLGEMETKGKMEGTFLDIKYPRDILRTEDLSNFSEIFNAVKEKILLDDEGNKEERVFAATDLLFNRLFETDQQSRPESLADLYSTELDEKRKRETEETLVLQNHLLEYGTDGTETGINKKRLKTTRLSNGFQLTFADVSGLNVRHGGPGLAMEAVQRHTLSLSDPNGVETDILIFANDEFGPDNRPNGRKKLMIKIPKRRHGLQGVNLEELAARLNVSEELFGGGKALASYGGHDEVVLSAQFEGTELNPEKLYVGLQQFFAIPRSTQAEFEERAQAFADKLGTTNYSIKLAEPQNEYDISQRAIVLPRSGGGVVSISEDEIALYESVFSQNPAENIQIIEQKTEKSESPEIKRARIPLAKEKLDRALIEGNAPQMLEALAFIPAHEIEQIDEQTLFDMYEAIADDEVAISNVWNKNDGRFQIHGENVPDWMMNNPDACKKGRFDYLSTVQSKVDKIIADRLYQFMSIKANSELQSRFALCTEKILRSQPYKNSHTGETYDHHLQMMLQFISDKKMNGTARRMLANSFTINYGKEMSAHWQQVAEDSSDLLLSAIDQFPDYFEEIVDSVSFDKSKHRIEGVKASSKTEPDPEKIRQRIEEQRAQGIEPPRLSILIEIGRPIQSQLLSKEIRTFDAAMHTRKDVIGNFDGVIKVNGFIDIGHDERLIAAELLRQIQIVEDAVAGMRNEQKPELRIIFGSFPGPLQNKINKALSRPDEKEKRVDIGGDLRERIVICQYNQPKQEFYDEWYNEKEAA